MQPIVLDSFCATNGASSTICAASDIRRMECAAPASAQFLAYILTQVGQSPTQPCQSYASLLLHPCNLLMPPHPLDDDLDPPGLCNLGSVVYTLTQVRQNPTSLLLQVHLKLLLHLIPIAPISPEILELAPYTGGNRARWPEARKHTEQRSAVFGWRQE